MYNPPTNGHEMALNQLSEELRDLKDRYRTLRTKYKNMLDIFVPPEHYGKWYNIDEEAEEEH